MTFEVLNEASAKRVRLVGELVDEQHDFVEAVTSILGSERLPVLIDMTEVPFMNSQGLTNLVRIVAQANTQEGRVILVAPSAFVAGVFQTTQLDRFFEISPNLGDALARLTTA